MAHDLSLLIRRQSVAPAPRRAASVALPVDPAILDSGVARRLGRSTAPRRRWIDDPSVRDALVAFVLTFTGAIIFLL